MVVATEFFDRRPRREPGPARRLMMPYETFSDSITTKTTYTDDSVVRTQSDEKEEATKAHAATMVSAWDFIERSYNELRVQVTTVAGCSLQQADSLLQHLPGYYRLQQADSIARIVFRKPTRLWSAEDQKQINIAVRDGERALRDISQQLEALSSNSDRLQRLVRDSDTLDSSDTDSAELHTAWCRGLMVRRAAIRSAALQANYKLQKLPSYTAREEQIARQLERFAPLEDFSNTIQTDDEAIALHKVLHELEPLFASIKPLLPLIREPHEIPVIPQQKVVTEEPKVRQSRKPRNRSTHTIPALGTELGEYDVTWGDTIEDILFGDTGATELPVLNQLSTSYRQRVIEEVQYALETSPAFCSWIGLPYPASELLGEVGEGQTYRINIDKLHDLVALVAVDQGAINLPSQTEKTLVQLMTRVLRTYEAERGDTEQFQEASQPKTIRSLDDLWPALCSYVGVGRRDVRVNAAKGETKKQGNLHTLAPIHNRIRRIESQVTEQFFSGDKERFNAAMHDWAREHLLVRKRSGRLSRSDDVMQDLTNTLAPMQLATIATLVQPGAEQRRWLRLHRFESSDWQRVMAVVTRWQALAEREQCSHPSLSFGDLLQVMYAIHLIDEAGNEGDVLDGRFSTLQ